ncbi:N-acetylmuramoyl-L-alanine amidase [Bacillus cereus group sp. TH152-1LC]|uniref:N-acetylmuramoyl-L-alanine amidase n=1 Tax=Bacillus cereus group sp. TH152-1LC TaxID=3018060 RepID=UPI0022E0BABC|nr:N-acetylmuramoyl-L-alanine amidase [Bacillus cereus group sp. TH152-1LC]MDA1675238.1 lysozyme family protein [Bacillus cereus group sp. TH152-1LC]
MRTPKHLVLVEDLGFMDPELDVLIAKLAPEERKKINHLLTSKNVKRATIIAALSAMGFTGAMQVKETFSSFPTTSSSDTNHVANVQKAKQADTKVLGEVVYSPESKFGVKGEDFKTSAGHEKIGTLYKSQSEKVKYSAIRPVLMKEGVAVSTSEVKDNQFKESVTYKAADQKVYAPDKGEVFQVSKDGLVIEHQKGKLTYFSVMKGITPADSIKKGQKIDQATFLGSASELDYSVAMNYDSKAKEFYEFVHPNEFVDIEKSDNFRYATGEYKAKSEPVIKAKSASLQKELESELAELPKEVKESVVTRGLVIENKQQMASLKGNKDFYREENLPIQYLENGKANVSPKVEALRPMLMAELKKKGLERFCDFLLAKIQQESGGDEKILSADPMQSSQSKNEIPDSITDPKESIEYGVAHFENMMKLNNMFDPLAYGDVRQAIHSYNFGSRVSVIAKKEGIPYSLAFMKEQSSNLAKEYYQKTGMARFKPNHDWRGEAAYGDVTYVAKIFNVFEPSKDWESRSEEAIKEAHQKLEEKEKQENAVKKAAPVEKKEEVKKSEPVEKSASAEKKKEVQKPAKGNGNGLPYELYDGFKNNQAAVIAEYKKEEDKLNSISSDYKTTTLTELPDSKSLEGVIIAIDAGHGKHDTGTVALDGHHEADDTKNTADFAEEYFKRQGATVIRVRKNNDDFVPVVERGRIFNKNNVDMAFSFHENSADNPSANRSEVLFKAGHPESQRLAEITTGYVKQALPKVQSGKAISRSDLGMFNASKRPTVILEPYFVSSPYGNDLSKTDNALKSVALTTVYAAYEYLGKELPKEEVKKEEAPKDSKEKTKENKSETKETPKEEKKSSGVTEEIENFISNVFKKDKEKEEPKKEEPVKQEETKKEETSKEEPKKEETKEEDSKKEETSKEESKKEETKEDDSKKEETSKEESKKEESKKEESKKEESKEEESKEEPVKKEETSKEKSKEESKKEESKEESKKEESKAVSVNTNDNVVHYDFVNKKQVATASPKEESTKNETKESADDVSFVWDFVQKNRTRV